jgi:hypothetical protein
MTIGLSVSSASSQAKSVFCAETVSIISVFNHNSNLSSSSQLSCSTHALESVFQAFSKALDISYDASCIHVSGSSATR